MNHEYPTQSACCPTNGASACAPTNAAATRVTTNVAPSDGAAGATASPSGANGAAPVSAPRFRVSSSAEAVTLRVELPGVAQGNVSLHVEDGVLHLDAKQSLSPTGAEVVRQALEFRLADYRGRWRLPENVDVDGISSTLRHGVLELTLPLAKPARRTIQVAG